MMPTTDRKEEVGLKGSEMEVFVGCSMFCGVGDKEGKPSSASGGTRFSRIVSSDSNWTSHS